MSDGARLPSFQFYPADWQGNSNLRRCSHEEKGIWIDVMCILHDQAEYGMVRWPLAEIATAIGTNIKKLRAVVAKGVMKGADSGLVHAFVYTPRSGRKMGDPVTLIPAQDGPLWYSSRMVKDAHKRRNAGATTRFGASPDSSPSRSPDDAPRRTPRRRLGVDQSDGSTSSSSSSSAESPLGPPGDARGARLPEDWKPDDELVTYCSKQGYTRHQTDFIAHRFVNHWTAATGRTARKRDWRRAFQNWVTNERRQIIVDGATSWAPNGNGADAPVDWPLRMRIWRESGGQEWLERWGPKPGEHGFQGPPVDDLFPPERPQ